jgi:iron complex transport system ATP-binding protein
MKLSAQNITIMRANNLICHELNLSLNTGDIWGILGANGCGKTSILHALAGLLAATSGSVFVNEIPLTQLSHKKIAQTIGLLFQDFSTSIAQSVWEYCLASRFPHLSYFKKESDLDKKIALDALKKMQLEHVLHRPIHMLSGGEKRRLAIAGLLTQSPDIYLLDEPNNHLDLHQQISILNHFKYLAEKQSATILMTLHDVNLAQQFCQFVILMFGNGEIIHGPVNEILSEENLSRLYQCSIAAVKDGGITYWYPKMSSTM